MKPRRRKNRSAISPERWLSYTLAGLASAVAAAQQAEAEVHYSGIVDLQLTGEEFSTRASLPLTRGAFLSFRRGLSFVGEYDYFAIGGAERAAARGTYSFLYAVASKLPPRSKIPNGPFLPISGLHKASLANIYGSGNFGDVGEGFVGFKFNVGSGTQYGWMRVKTVHPSPFNKLVIVDYAWADPGEKLLTGERRSKGSEEGAGNGSPDSLGLLAYGHRGVLASRAWKKNQRP